MPNPHFQPRVAHPSLVSGTAFFLSPLPASWGDPAEPPFLLVCAPCSCCPLHQGDGLHRLPDPQSSPVLWNRQRPPLCLGHLAWGQACLRTEENSPERVYSVCSCPGERAKARGKNRGQGQTVSQVRHAGPGLVSAHPGVPGLHWPLSLRSSLDTPVPLPAGVGPRVAALGYRARPMPLNFDFPESMWEWGCWEHISLGLNCWYLLG